MRATKVANGIATVSAANTGWDLRFRQGMIVTYAYADDLDLTDERIETRPD